MDNSPPAIVRRLQTPTEPEIDRILSIFLAAFHDDLLTRFFVGGDTSRIRAKFEANLRAGVIGGVIYVAATGPKAEDIVGASLWYGPGQASMLTEEQRAAGWNQFLAASSDELRRWWIENFIPTMTRLGDSLGPSFKLQQWHLLLFGVAPEHHRKGYGKAIMTTVEKLAKADGVSIVLETPTELDVTIYKRLGFHIEGQAVVTSPLGETPIYQMIKTP